MHGLRHWSHRCIDSAAAPVHAAAPDGIVGQIAKIVVQIGVIVAVIIGHIANRFRSGSVARHIWYKLVFVTCSEWMLMLLVVPFPGQGNRENYMM